MSRITPKDSTVGQMPEWMKPEFDHMDLPDRTDTLLTAFRRRDNEVADPNLVALMFATLSEWKRKAVLK